MDSEFPPFTQSGFYREWLKGVAMFPNITEEQKRETLGMAYAIYSRVKLRSQGIDPDLPDWPGMR